MIKGTKHTPEARARISRAKKGKPCSETTKAKISAKLTGRKMDPEIVRRVAQTRLRQRNIRLGLIPAGGNDGSNV